MKQEPGPSRGLIVATMGVLLLAAMVGGGALERPDVGTPRGTPIPSTGPVRLQAAGALTPGTYVLANPYLDDDPVRDCARGCSDYQRILFTLPAGWATSDGLVHKQLGRSGEVAFSAWTVGDVYADPCHWQDTTLGPLDLDHAQIHEDFHAARPGSSVVPEAWDGGLAHQVDRGASALVATRLGGEPALKVELSVPNHLDLATCHRGEYRSWTEWDVVDRGNSHHVPGQIDVVYMVDVDRRPLVIDASHMPATSEEDLAELGAVLASMVIDRGELETPAPSFVR